MKLLMVSWLLFFSSLFAHGANYPQTPSTSGHLCTVADSDFETYRYSQKIPYCKRNVSVQLKKEIYDNYNIPQQDRRDYTIDHIIPLSVGGSNHPANLWPEHRDIKDCRYSFEVEIFKAVRDGLLTQDEAIHEIRKVKFVEICVK